MYGRARLGPFRAVTVHQSERDLKSERALKSEVSVKSERGLKSQGGLWCAGCALLGVVHLGAARLRPSPRVPGSSELTCHFFPIKSFRKSQFSHTSVN